jgi:uncharacterized protein (TIGR00106 family)
MLASFAIIPVGVGEEMKVEVAKVIDLIDRSGLSYRVGAMQTTVEGEMDQVMGLILKCHQLMKSLAPRVLTTITIDDRTGAHDRLEGKVQDVESVLGRKVRHA